MRNRRFALALSVHFKQKDLGMKKFEILSRGTAFFLSVDPPDLITSEESSGQGSNNSNYKHLKGRKRRMQNLDNKTDAIDRGFLKTRAKGLKNRELKDLGWLEFCPVEYRHAVHVVAAAHVLSPFRYLDTYYSEQKSWLQSVKQENCAYSFDVFYMSSQHVESIAKFALNPYPIHHPEMDLGLIHLKDETQALKQLESLGIESVNCVIVRKIHTILMKHYFSKASRLQHLMEQIKGMFWPITVTSWTMMNFLMKKRKK